MQRHRQGDFWRALALGALGWGELATGIYGAFLIGGLGGALQTGRSLSYMKDGDDNRKLSSLYLSLMDRYGVKVDKFGDATERLLRI